MKKISNELYCYIADQLEKDYGAIPFKQKGICINEKLIKTALEILNDEEIKCLPQNCRNLLCFKFTDGLDKRIKDILQSDQRTANIISDVLASIGILNIKERKSIIRRLIKTTILKEQYYWYINP